MAFQVSKNAQPSSAATWRWESTIFGMVGIDRTPPRGPTSP
jgi:hypothetical protein